MKKLYFGILLLFSIIFVSLSFISGIGRSREGLTTSPTEIKCSTYKWVPNTGVSSSGSLEWSMIDLSSGKLLMKTSYPSNVKPTCKNVILKCQNYVWISEPLYPPIPIGSNTPSTTMTSWIKVDLSGIIISSGFMFPNNKLPECENFPSPSPSPVPKPTTTLPPWKTFSLGILSETQQGINNLIQAESDKIRSVSLK
jgi:hypothetical protein